MGTVFKKTFTKPVPAGAETFVRKGERLARWKDRRGKTRTAPLTVGEDGSERVVIESPYYVAKYRDGAGTVCVVATGCRDETAARQVLADLERKAELVRSKIITAAEAAVGDHQAAPLSDHIDAYLAYLEVKGACKGHRSERRRQLERVAADCAFHQLADLDRTKVESWLTQQARAGMGARTRNSYLASALAFCNWCIEPNVNRLTHNPFDGIPKADEKSDPRRQRRAMVETELVRLLDVARERPLIEALTVRKGPRKGERYANVRPEVRERLELLGRERALIYKTLVLTGLRKGELASLTAVQLRLDGAVPFVALDAADEKNREGNDIALRDDLAADLRDWLADKLSRLQDEARRDGDPIPARLPPDAPLFDVPHKLCKILNRDLRLAGIPKRDERGRTLDVHALRHTFGTLLSKGGVAPRTAQAAMRHSKLDLTMNVYTDPKLLDVRGALDALPDLPLAGGREPVAATGTDAPQPIGCKPLAPTLAPTLDNLVQAETIPVSLGGDGGKGTEREPLAVSAYPGKRKHPPTSPVSGCLGVGATGLEPVQRPLDRRWVDGAAVLQPVAGVVLPHCQALIHGGPTLRLLWQYCNAFATHVAGVIAHFDACCRRGDWLSLRPAVWQRRGRRLGVAASVLEVTVATGSERDNLLGTVLPTACLLRLIGSEGLCHVIVPAGQLDVATLLQVGSVVRSPPPGEGDSNQCACRDGVDQGSRADVTGSQNQVSTVVVVRSLVP